MQGSLINRLYEGPQKHKPEIGMHCTVMHYSDRSPAEVIAISPSGKTLQVRELSAKRTDKNGMSECQSYEYATDPEGTVRTFRLTKRGWRGPGGGPGLALGRAEKYHDFSF